MAVLKTKDGVSIEFEPLVYDENNLSKTRLSKRDSLGEGIWIVVSEKDKKDIDEDKKDGYFVAMLANDALNFPFPSWGMHIVCKHMGEDRPEADVEWVDYDDPTNRIFTPDQEEETV